MDDEILCKFILLHSMNVTHVCMLSLLSTLVLSGYENTSLLSQILVT